MGTMSALLLLQSVLRSTSEASFCEFLARYSTSSEPSRAGKLAEFLRSSASSASDREATLPAWPGEYPRETVLGELLQDAVSHALSRGLPFAEVYRFTRLYVQCLGLLTDQRGSPGDTLPTLTTSVIEFKSMVLKCAKEFSHHSLLSIIDYITTTLFQHYHLYQYLLTEEQPNDSTIFRLDVETAENDPPPPLNTAMSATELERGEKVKELESMQAEREKKYLQSREMALQRESENLTAAYREELSQLQKSELTEEKLSQIIDSLAKAHIQSVKTAVSQDMEKHELDIEFRVQKLETVSPKRVGTTPQPHSPCKSTSPSKNERR